MIRLKVNWLFRPNLFSAQKYEGIRFVPNLDPFRPKFCPFSAKPPFRPKIYRSSFFVALILSFFGRKITESRGWRLGHREAAYTKSLSPNKNLNLIFGRKSTRFGKKRTSLYFWPKSDSFIFFGRIMMFSLFQAHPIPEITKNIKRGFTYTANRITISSWTLII